MENRSGFTTYFPAGYPPVPPRGGPFVDPSSPPAESPSSPSRMPDFDIFEWHVAYQSCQRFFLDHAQHESGPQAICALMNICLPFQWMQNPVTNSSGPLPHSSGPAAYNMHWPRHGPLMNAQGQPVPAWVSLIPYIRRLIVTGFDTTGCLLGFFGEDWRKGVGPLVEIERRNYLFAAKSGGWEKCKVQYDMSPHETVPFIKPLQGPHLLEIEAAERTWSHWLAMEDWMVGPRAPHADEEMPGMSRRGS